LADQIFSLIVAEWFSKYCCTATACPIHAISIAAKIAADNALRVRVALIRAQAKKRQGFAGFSRFPMPTADGRWFKPVDTTIFDTFERLDHQLVGIDGDFESCR
jgi:hypothetical protein